MAKLFLGIFILFLVISAITIFLLRVRAALWKPLKSSRQVYVFGYYSHVLTQLKYGRSISVKFQPAEWAKLRRRLAPAVEWILITVWALWLGRHYLALNSAEWLPGDWSLNVQSYFAWDLVNTCGACVFWNGFFNGGAPLFADLLAAMAHPLVVIFIVLGGVINGSKLIGIAGLILAGFAQWYWGKVLGLGSIARLWGAAMAMVGGHLIGRLEGGLVEMVFSTASFSLASAAAVHLAETGNRRVAIALGIFTGLAFLSGQGYLQLAFIFGICPALIILLIDRQFKILPVWREFIFAAGIAILISAILWVPVFHTLSSISKPTVDLEFGETQSMQYQPLNLVIRDYDFYNSFSLGKLAWPNQTVNYIGWIPLLFVLISFRFIPRSRLKLMIFLWTAIILVYALSSAALMKFLIRVAPLLFERLLTMARFPSLMAGLAVPFILVLAAWGVDLALRQEWPKLTFRLPYDTIINFNIKWLAILMLIVSVRACYTFVQPWLETMHEPDEVAKYQDIIPRIKPETSQWVEPPYGDWVFPIVALENHVKLTNIYHLWNWSERVPPLPYLQTTHDPIDPSNPNYSEELESLNLLLYSDHEYAYVDTGEEKIPCKAYAMGGNIDVDCQADVPGELVVTENSFSGWSVRRDDKRVPLVSSQWLTTKAPAGAHHYEFRYRPWDVPLGLILSLFGIGLSIWWWMQTPSNEDKSNTTPRKTKTKVNHSI